VGPNSLRCPLVVPTDNTHSWWNRRFDPYDLIGCAALGNYVVSVNATSGGVLHQILVSVNIVDFSVTSGSSTLTILAGRTNSTTVRNYWIQQFQQYRDAYGYLEPGDAERAVVSLRSGQCYCHKNRFGQFDTNNLDEFLHPRRQLHSNNNCDFDYARRESHS